MAIASGLVARSTILKEDTSLASFYLLSLALGVLIVSVRGNNVDLLHMLLGTVLSLNNEALLLLGAIASLTMGGLALLYRPLVLKCLDPAFLRMVSLWNPVAHYWFLGLLVLNLVAGFHALGTLMAVGLLVLPATTARLWVRQLAPMLFLSTCVALLGCSSRSTWTGQAVQRLSSALVRCTSHPSHSDTSVFSGFAPPLL